MKDNRIDGNGNILVNGNVTLSVPAVDRATLLAHLFASADAQFRAEVDASGRILRLASPTDYSSEALFTSLMQVGVPADVALSLPFEIVRYLRERAERNHCALPLSTTDVRIAVVEAMQGLMHCGRFTEENVTMWCAAYMRRFGNPANEFIKVIDAGEQRDLNYEYIQSTLLPHLLTRILGLPRGASVLEDYPEIFSWEVVKRMSREIMGSINTLNLYTIRYKAILYLLEEIVLEPPHPWLVNPRTIATVTRYNLERASHHWGRVHAPSVIANDALLYHAYREFFRHACAAILARYGAFLGVGERYGLSELRRILKMKRDHATLWECCRIRRLDDDLYSASTSVPVVAETLKKVAALMDYAGTGRSRWEALHSNAEYLHGLAQRLCSEPGDA